MDENTAYKKSDHPYTKAIPSPYHLHSDFTFSSHSWSAKKRRKHEDGIKKVLLLYDS